MTDLIDAEIAAVKRNGHKDPAKKKEREVGYFIDNIRLRKEEEERKRKAAADERAKRLADERAKSDASPGSKPKPSSNGTENDKPNASKPASDRQSTEKPAARRRDRERDRDRDRDRERGRPRDRQVRRRSRSPIRRRRRDRSPPRRPPRRRSRSRSPRRRGSRSRSISPYRGRRRSRSRSYDRRRRRRGGSYRKRSRSRSRPRSRSRSRQRRRVERRNSKSRSRSRSRSGKRRDRSRSRSASSSSQESTASTALIQKILAQNPKGAMAVQQHKSQKGVKTEEKAELIKAQAIALSKGASVLSNSPMEIVKRQLYVGNLPLGIQPHALVDFLNEAMITRKLIKSPGNPFIKVNLNGDGSFGFATLRTSEETDLALLHLNGIACLGQGLKLGRPKSYEGSGPSADSMGIPLQPLNIAANDAQSLLSHLEQKLQETYRETGMPSPVIRIANMLNEETMKDQQELDDIQEEVKEECQGYGSVVEVRMPKLGDMEHAYVYVHMGSKAEAEIACDKLSGRSFDGKALKVTFAPLEAFMNKKENEEPKDEAKAGEGEEKTEAAAAAVPTLNAADAADID